MLPCELLSESLSPGWSPDEAQLETPQPFSTDRANSGSGSLKLDEEGQGQEEAQGEGGVRDERPPSEALPQPKAKGLSWSPGDLPQQLAGGRRVPLRLELELDEGVVAAQAAEQLDAAGRFVLKTSGGTEVRYEVVEGRDGRPSAHLNVAEKFAIGSRGMYQPSDDDGQGGRGAYPPQDPILDETGSNLLELGVLGRGAGSIQVVKAVHLPSMRMVAVKKVRCVGRCVVPRECRADA
jgi:hypothetical protein